MELHQFEFTGEIIDRFTDECRIPVNFYNKNGQILINKKEGASVHEINALLKFQDSGIFYDQADYDEMTGKKRVAPARAEYSQSQKIPHGLKDTKLLSRQFTEELAALAAELFDRLKKEALDSVLVQSANKKLTRLFDEFSAQPDAMVGLLNILELMSGAGAELQVELGVNHPIISISLTGILIVRSG